MDQAKLSFITGGVRSGKSSYAEQRLVELAKEVRANRLVYLATGVAFDEEMTNRIERHKHDRTIQEHQWVTIEQPTNFKKVLVQVKQGDAILWDCVTTWLSNEFYEQSESGVFAWKQEGRLKQRMDEMKSTILQIRTMGIPLAIVSNEMLDEPLSTNPEVHLYQQTIGRLHQWFVKNASEAIEIDYGFIHKWK